MTTRHLLPALTTTRWMESRIPRQDGEAAEYSWQPHLASITWSNNIYGEKCGQLLRTGGTPYGKVPEQVREHIKKQRIQGGLTFRCPRWGSRERWRSKTMPRKHIRSTTGARSETRWSLFIDFWECWLEVTFGHIYDGVAAQIWRNYTHTVCTGHPCYVINGQTEQTSMHEKKKVSVTYNTGGVNVWAGTHLWDWQGTLHTLWSERKEQNNPRRCSCPACPGEASVLQGTVTGRNVCTWWFQIMWRRYFHQHLQNTCHGGFWKRFGNSGGHVHRRGGGKKGGGGEGQRGV